MPPPEQNDAEATLTFGPPSFFQRTRLVGPDGKQVEFWTLTDDGYEIVPIEAPLESGT